MSQQAIYTHGHAEPVLRSRPRQRRRGVRVVPAAWAEHPDGWFSLLHGELLARG